MKRELLTALAALLVGAVTALLYTIFLTLIF